MRCIDWITGKTIRKIIRKIICKMNLLYPHIRQIDNGLLSYPQNHKEDMNMRTVFKILLAPVWLLLAILKLVFRLAAGAAAFVLAISGGLLLVYDLFLLIIGLGSKELLLQLLTIGGLLIAVPLLAGVLSSLLEAAQEPIEVFIES